MASSLAIQHSLIFEGATVTAGVRRQHLALVWDRDAVGSERKADNEDHLRQAAVWLTECGWNLLYADRLEAARTAANNAIALDPENAVAHCLIGQSHLFADENDAAIKACQQSINMNPQYGWAHVVLTSGLLAERRYEEAIKAGHRIIEITPRFAWGHSLVGAAYVGASREAEAIPYFERAVELGGTADDAHATGILGELLLRDGSIDAAIPLCIRAVELDPNRAESHAVLAAALVQAGRFTDAIEHGNRAISLNKEYEYAYEICAEAYSILGDQENFSKYAFRHTYRHLWNPYNDVAFNKEKYNIENLGKNYNDTSIVDNATERLKAVAADFGLSARVARKALTAAASEAARKATARAKTDARAQSPENWTPPALPLPKGLRWPREHFGQSPERSKHGGIIRHLERVWKPLIAAGAVDMPLLRAFYPSTAQGIDNYRHASPATRKSGIPRELPPDLDIPLGQPRSGRQRAEPQPG